ncbi:hypothetical protein [Tenacibaculum sp. A30]|uniref:hypothetical protein n=1 Tax=Tenacibaculum sp. A30 TaxID=3442644 RepID=UPI003EC02ACA
MKIKSLKNKHIVKLYLLLTLFLYNCYLIPCNLDSGLNQLTEKQKDSFFIGEYIVERSINNNFKTNNSIIKLKKDKTIEMNNMPIDIFDFIKSNKKINVQGTWKQNFIENRSKDKYFLPTDLKFGENDGTGLALRTIQVYVKEKKPVLFIEYGDPDECRAIRFIKK